MDGLLISVCAIIETHTHTLSLLCRGPFSSSNHTLLESIQDLEIEKSELSCYTKSAAPLKCNGMEYIQQNVFYSESCIDYTLHG